MYACVHLLNQDADGTAFISLDGNFRLCRRKNAGQQSTYEKPLSGDRIFVNQLDVDCFVQSSSSVTSDRDLDRVSAVDYFSIANLKSVAISFSVMNSRQETLCGQSPAFMH